MTLSQAVDRAIELAQSEGNGVKEISTGWTRMREVVYMTQEITPPLLMALTSMPQLRRWSVEATPQNAAEMGFIDDVNKVSINFPESRIAED